MKKIALSGKNGEGKFALVDDADYKLVSGFRWELHRQGYARMGSDQSPRLLMHRLILGTPRGVQVDHEKGDKLDNRRSKLRPATAAQNAANKPPRTKSGYKGVYWCDHSWQAAITINHRRIALGRFKDPRQAALAYNAAALNQWGEFAYLNEL